MAYAYQDFLDVERFIEEHRDELPIIGENDEGELTVVRLCEWGLAVDTLQDNGWVRTHYYHEDGTIEEMWSRSE